MSSGTYRPTPLWVGVLFGFVVSCACGAALSPFGGAWRFSVAAALTVGVSSALGWFVVETLKARLEIKRLSYELETERATKRTTEPSSALPEAGSPYRSSADHQVDEADQIATEIRKLNKLPGVDDVNLLEAYVAWLSPCVGGSPPDGSVRDSLAACLPALKAVVGPEVCRLKKQQRIGELRKELATLEQQDS